jgi:hypothetical protein
MHEGYYNNSGEKMVSNWWYDDGSPQENFRYNNGRLYKGESDVPFSGLTYIYSQINGTKLVQYSYKDGVKNGEYISYDFDGSIQRRIYFLNGEKHGPYITYDKEGNIVNEWNYLNGKIVKNTQTIIESKSQAKTLEKIEIDYSTKPIDENYLLFMATKSFLVYEALKSERLILNLYDSEERLLMTIFDKNEYEGEMIAISMAEVLIKRKFFIPNGNYKLILIGDNERGECEYIHNY